MVSDDELYKARTLQELDDFLHITKKSVVTDPEEIKKARLKKGNYKKYLEELVPLFLYGKHKYASENMLKYKLEKGNQAYDAIVFHDKETIEIIEFTSPIDGKAEHKKALQLNKNGFSEVITYWNTEEQEIVKERIVKKAKDKAIKTYNGKNLIILFDPFPYFELNDINDIKMIYQIVEELKCITYSADMVYMMTYPVITNTEAYHSEIFCIK
jgi:hypothetical protein